MIFLVILIFVTLDDIMNAILPENDVEELPSGFQLVGHIGKCK
jgi:hypothetical protein